MLLSAIKYSLCPLSEKVDEKMLEKGNNSETLDSANTTLSEEERKKHLLILMMEKQKEILKALDVLNEFLGNNEQFDIFDPKSYIVLISGLLCAKHG